MENKRFSIKDRIYSFKYAGRGVVRLVSREHNAWIHCAVTVCVIVAGGLLGLSTFEWIAVILCIGAVLAAEGVNSAIEALCDKVSPDTLTAFRSRLKPSAPAGNTNKRSEHIYTTIRRNILNEREIIP